MNGSYQFEQLEGRFQEAEFLSERAQMRLDGFPKLLERHGFPKQGRALEIGCGQGLRTLLMAKQAPSVAVVGVDRSDELLDFAKKQTSHGVSNLSFELANLYELPFADQSFDFVYARLVFMHLSNPEQALKEIRRVLIPGGRVLIEDADRDCMFFEPAPVSFPKYWQQIQEGQRRHGGDPNVGRKLASYLKMLKFKSVNTEVQTILGTGDDIAFLARTLLPSLNLYLDVKDRNEGDNAVRDLLELASQAEATFYHFWFAVSGERNA